MVQDSRSASYPGAAIASSYDFGCIDFFSMACMLLSGVPIPGCGSPLPLGPTFAFKETGLGLLPTAAGGRATATPTSVSALGGVLVGDSRVAAGVSELGPAMSDGESAPDEL
jgi:hypothetical protein